MRRIIVCMLSLSMTLAISAGIVQAQQPERPKLETLSVPAAQARSLATKLSIQYRDMPGVSISPDVSGERLVVMAPEATQAKIAADLRGMLASTVQQASAQASQPKHFALTSITWREFEDGLRQVAGDNLPITTSPDGVRAAFQLNAAPMTGTTVEVDRRNNRVTVVAPELAIPGWQKLIAAIDYVSADPNTVTEFVHLEKAEPAPIQKAVRLLQQLRVSHGNRLAAVPAGRGPFRNAVFQQNADAAGGGQDAAQIPPTDEDGLPPEEGGAGVIGDTQIQFVPELGQIIIRGSKRDVERVMEVIRQIELESELTKPDVQVRQLQHTDSNAVADLLQQLYQDVLSARQGNVSITALDTPNALLLIGREEALKDLLELIDKIDVEVPASSRLRVFRLQNASALDAEQTIRDFFTDRPVTNDDIRPGLGTRVRIIGDFRTNSLIVSAAPRDMEEITKMIDELDVEEHEATNQIKVFPLNNAIAEELAPVLQTAINGESEEANDNLTTPSNGLSILSVDGGQAIDSGILAGVLVTADAGANAIVVRAPSGSMPLIAELIRQLDKAPGIDSLVKVFTIKNGDASQLATALQTLFGEDAGTSGTQVGAANAGGLPPNTAGSESSLVPLRFSTDIRTNSIIASGAAEDLEVVESILLRLDSEGFAERITEVIWLRHQAAEAVALAIQDYVLQRTNGVNRIQQYQQGGLGPYDLPDRDLIVTHHFETNSLLISVSPRIYPEVRRLIDQLDRRPPMVLIKVLLAEVNLDDAFEIGGEVGLQDSLLYDRGIAAGAFPGATPPSNPGFNFNSPGPFGTAAGTTTNTANFTNNNSFGQESLAASGLTSFGVGRVNDTLGYGGFVLSAASESVSLLLRTLQDAGRAQVLSRPQIMTADNTEGFVQVGKLIARVQGTTVSNGISQLDVADIEVGLILRVLPRVGADGLIYMDVDATRSDRDNNTGTVITDGFGNPILINDINRTTAQSTIAAYSGQTVVFGGLIQKTRLNVSRRVPWVSNIPILGYLFKYDSEIESRSEVLVVLTPMLVNGDEDLEYVKQVESSRMSWCLADVVEAHGDVGLSGGYGLWGPAVGGTIYPDLQPTVIEERVISPSDPGMPIGSGHMIDAGLESTPVIPATPNSYQQGVLPAPSDRDILNTPSGTAPVIPEPVLVPGQLGANAEVNTPSVNTATEPPQPQAAGATRQVSWIAEVSEAARERSDASRPRPQRLGSSQQ